MLTESEKRWLQLRKLYAGVNRHSYYSCMHCSEYNMGRWPWYNYPCNRACLYAGCPFIDIGSSAALSDYVEAVEFESRVACKLLEMPEHRSPCSYGEARMCTIECASIWLDCKDCRLKWARLAVEEEMDADRK